MFRLFIFFFGICQVTATETQHYFMRQILITRLDLCEGVSVREWEGQRKKRRRVTSKWVCVLLKFEIAMGLPPVFIFSGETFPPKNKWTNKNQRNNCHFVAVLASRIQDRSKSHFMELRKPSMHHFLHIKRTPIESHTIYSPYCWRFGTAHAHTRFYWCTPWNELPFISAVIKFLNVLTRYFK